MCVRVCMCFHSLCYYLLLSRVFLSVQKSDTDNAVWHSDIIIHLARASNHLNISCSAFTLKKIAFCFCFLFCRGWLSPLIPRSRALAAVEHAM